MSPPGGRTPRARGRSGRRSPMPPFRNVTTPGRPGCWCPSSTRPSSSRHPTVRGLPDRWGGACASWGRRGPCQTRSDLVSLCPADDAVSGSCRSTTDATGVCGRREVVSDVDTAALPGGWGWGHLEHRRGWSVTGRWGEERGAPWEYDPGPPRNRRMGRLFAQTPNYRGLGRAVTGREAFRWHFGPMFYRGRLVDGHVKVLVIGQEGAQDESLAARAFVGGSGSRMQHLLRHLGITRSVPQHLRLPDLRAVHRRSALARPASGLPNRRPPSPHPRRGDRAQRAPAGRRRWGGGTSIGGDLGPFPRGSDPR